jgi:hypothetical protein
LEELKQTFVQMDRFLSNLSITPRTPGSRETSKHSKAMSGVKLHFSRQQSLPSAKIWCAFAEGRGP